MFTNYKYLTKFESSKFSVSLWKSKEERSISIWTPMCSMSLDLGRTLFGDEDEFGVTVRKQAWGLVFYGKTPNLASMDSSRKGFYGLHKVKNHPDYEKEKLSSWRHYSQLKLEDIDAGKAKDPINMTRKERSESTRKLIRSLKWSRDFVHNMATPTVYLAIENGGTAYDGFGGGIILTEEQMEILKAQIESGQRLSLPTPIKTIDASWGDTIITENILGNKDIKGIAAGEDSNAA